MACSRANFTFTHYRRCYLVSIASDGGISEQQTGKGLKEEVLAWFETFSQSSQKRGPLVHFVWSLQDHVLIVGYGPSERRIIYFFVSYFSFGHWPQLLCCCCFALRENNDQSVLTALLCVCNCCQRVGHNSWFSLQRTTHYSSSCTVIVHWQ